MEYNTAVQRAVAVFVAISMLVLAIPSWGNNLITWVSGMVVFLLLVLSGVSYRLYVNDETIRYQIRLVGQVLYTKHVLADEIKHMSFRRSNWKAKSTIIKVKRGFAIRVVLFKPETVYEDLLNFCARNGVAYDKTRDYKIIEKLAK